MTVRFAWMALFGAIVVLGVSAPVQAGQGPCFFSGCCYGWGPWLYPTDCGFIQRPPHFALFPPVYYSEVVKRPYGLSPFAWPPVLAADWAPADYGRDLHGPSDPWRGPEGSVPEVIQNPHVSPLPATTSAPARPRPSEGPLRVVNPYVVTVPSQTGSPLASRPAMPRRVYPAALARRTD